MFILHMLIILRIPILLNDNMYIHIMLENLHTQSMLVSHTLIMLLYIVEFIHALIVTEKDLAKFCFDRINASNNHIWVQNANIIGPKKIWVPKSTNSLFDVGTHQGFKT